ncbi:MAG: discoidin domain-containing protein, partial [Methylococcaceae bacterium]
GSGVMLTLSRADQIGGLRFTTAADAPERDPLTYTVYGSNDRLDWGSTAWVQIATGATGLSTNRQAASTVSIASSVSYSNYKVVFNTLRDASKATSMQISELSLLGTVASITAITPSSANSPAAEQPANAFDGNPATKYLNFDGINSGVTMKLSVPTVVDGLTLVTRTNDDIWQWDPKTYKIYGSNTDGTWNSAAWTLIGSGNTNLDNARGASSTVSFTNTTAYSYYKVVFTDIKGVTSDGKKYVHVSDIFLKSGTTTLNGLNQSQAFGTQLGGTGVTWQDVTRGALNNGNWYSVDTDAKGTRLVASTYDGQLFYADTTVGNWSWKKIGSISDGVRTRISISDDATTIVATSNSANGGILVTKDLGLNWTRQAGPWMSGNPVEQAVIDPVTGRITARLADLPIISYQPVNGSAAPNLVLPDQISVKGDVATPLSFPVGTLADADTSTPVTLDMSLTTGSLSASQGVAGVTVTALANGIRLTGTVSALSAYLATSGNVKSLPSQTQGLAGPLVVTVSDGTDTVTRSVALAIQKPVALVASYNGGSLDILATAATNPMQIKRSGINDIRLGKLDDDLTIVRLSDTPLVIRASEGADSTVFTLGNTPVPKDGSLRTLALKDVDGETAATSQLVNDDLTVKLPALSKSTTGNVIALGGGQLISGVEKVTWDENLGTLNITGDSVTLKALDGVTGIDLGKVKINVTSQNATIIGNLTAQSITLNVSGKLSVQGQLTVRDGTAPVIRNGVITSTSVEGESPDLWVASTEAPVRQSRMAHRSAVASGIEQQVAVTDTAAAPITLTRNELTQATGDALRITAVGALNAELGISNWLKLEGEPTEAHQADSGDISLSGFGTSGRVGVEVAGIRNGSLEGSTGRVAMMPGMSILSGDTLEDVLNVSSDDQNASGLRTLNGFNRTSRHALASGELSHGLIAGGLNRSTDALLGAALHLGVGTQPKYQPGETLAEDGGFIRWMALTEENTRAPVAAVSSFAADSGLRVIDLSLEDDLPQAAVTTATEHDQPKSQDLGQRFDRWLDAQKKG